MANFIVKGPFEVPSQLNRNGRYISSAEGAQFWKKHPALAKQRGCYVFAFRASKGYKPLYVGKATKTFGQEVFDYHKRDKYNQGLQRRKKGTPVLFFVCLGKARGPTNKSAIDEVESHLIQAGLAANRNLSNSRKVKPESWSIQGVVRSSAGKPSTSSCELRKCLKIQT